MTVLNMDGRLKHLELKGVVETGEEIGRGAYATVYKINVDGTLCAGKQLHNVIVTKITVDKFVEECLCHSEQRHENIVQFTGVFLSPSSRLPVLVMEYLPISLSQCLETNQDLSLQIKYSILLDVAKGLDYLHNKKPPVVHRDLTANNVLLTSDYVAKISDLGVSRILESIQYKLTKAPGNPYVMPPEALSDNPQYDHKLDVFSYGCLILCVFTHEWPIPSAQFVPNENGMYSLVSEWDRRSKYTLLIPSDNPFSPFAKKCLLNDPQSRPSITEAMKCLPIPGLCGLTNLGNTSFMNSILQCLSNTQPLLEYFIERKPAPYMKNINISEAGGTLVESYRELLLDMWSGVNLHIIPKKFKLKIDEQFSDALTHDPQKLLAFLLDTLHENLKKPVDTAIKNQEIVEEQQSVIVSLFQGQLKSTLHCSNCKINFVIFNPFMYLSLPLFDNKTNRNIFVYLVKSDPSQYQMKLKLTVPKNSTINNLKKAIQHITEIDSTRLVVIDVYQNRFHRVYYDKDPINHITDKDDIYVYELCAPPGDPDWVPVPVYMREIRVHKSYNYYGQKNVTTYGQVFGLPIVITVPRKGCIYRTLYNTILLQLKNYIVSKPVKFKDVNVEESDTKDLFKLVVVNSYGSQEVEKLNAEKSDLLKLTSATYISCDWEVDVKEQYYDLQKADTYEEHESCKHVITISSCMDLFLHTKDVWYCPKCKDSVQTSKKFLWKMPEILIIHLKRNNTESRIEFSLEGLDLSKYIANKEESRPVYDLFAVCNCSGDHCTAYAKNMDNGNWYSFDDDHVSSIEPNPSIICSSAAYILFYKRRTEEF